MIDAETAPIGKPFRTEASRTAIRYASTNLFYSVHAAAYAQATLQQSMDHWLLPFTSSLPARAKILDLGCGCGRDLRRFASLGLNPVGIDSSKSLAEFARFYSNCVALEGDMRHLPFENRSFTAAWASASLLHLSREDTLIALSEVRRVLTPGSLFFSSVKRGAGEGADEDGRWFTYYTPDQWRKQLEQGGFELFKTSDHSRKDSDLWISTFARSLA